MSTDVWEPKPPKLPKLPHLVAVALELAVAVTFLYHRSLFGLGLCVAYLWFSATWALIHLNDEE